MQEEFVEEYLELSAPRDNVRFVPRKSVRLTAAKLGCKDTGPLLMTQAERDQLVTLRKAQKEAD
jgi:hypothetical protein